MRLRDLKERYAIVGVGYTPQGKVPGRTALSFHLEACANAIADAGLKKEDIDGLICYRRFSPKLGEPEVTTMALPPSEMRQASQRRKGSATMGDL